MLSCIADLFWRPNGRAEETRPCSTQATEREKRRHEFPIGIAITRESAYGPTSSRNVYASELTAEELEDYQSKGGGYPALVEIQRITDPYLTAELPDPDADLQPDEVPSQPDDRGASESDQAGLPSPAQRPPSTSFPIAAQTLRDSSSSVLPPDFDRHSRRCIICSHPHRDAIEGDFIRWTSPTTIAKIYKIADRASIYRHAHSTGLFERRKREVGRVLETILENGDQCPVEHFDTMIRAARLYTHLDDSGCWTEPPRITYFIAGPPPGPHNAQPANSAPPRKRKLRSSKTKRFLTATGPHSGSRLKP
jgi:hypothetical protein